MENGSGLPMIDGRTGLRTIKTAVTTAVQSETALMMRRAVNVQRATIPRGAPGTNGSVFSNSSKRMDTWSMKIGI
jgi:hypothetical protein